MLYEVITLAVDRDSRNRSAYDFESMSDGMAAAARTGVVADNFGLDPKLV